MTESPTSGFLWSRWQRKRSSPSRRMHNPQFCVSGMMFMIFMDKWLRQNNCAKVHCSAWGSSFDTKSKFHLMWFLPYCATMPRCVSIDTGLFHTYITVALRIFSNFRHPFEHRDYALGICSHIIKWLYLISATLQLSKNRQFINVTKRLGQVEIYPPVSTVCIHNILTYVLPFLLLASRDVFLQIVCWRKEGIFGCICIYNSRNTGIHFQLP